MTRFSVTGIPGRIQIEVEGETTQDAADAVLEHIKRVSHVGLAPELTFKATDAGVLLTARATKSLGRIAAGALLGHYWVVPVE